MGQGELGRTRYQACLTGAEAPKIQPGADRVKPGTFDELIIGHPNFSIPAPERWRAKYGSGRVADLETRHVAAMMADYRSC